MCEQVFYLLRLTIFQCPDCLAVLIVLTHDTYTVYLLLMYFLCVCIFQQDGGSREEELAILACQQYLKLKVDLLYGHHLDMLPLNKVTVENLGPKKEVPSPVKTKRRRIKMTSDLYDSEGSDSESTDVAQTSAIVEETPKHKQREENSPELVGALSGFADFYDSISFTDTMRSLEERIVGDRNSVNGMTEDPLIHEHSELWMQDHLSEVCASVQWASLSTLNHRLRQVTRGLVQDERFTIPVLKGRTSTLTQGIACPDTRLVALLLLFSV